MLPSGDLTPAGDQTSVRRTWLQRAGDAVRLVAQSLHAAYYVARFWLLD